MITSEHLSRIKFFLKKMDTEFSLSASFEIEYKNYIDEASSPRYVLYINSILNLTTESLDEIFSAMEKIESHSTEIKEIENLKRSFK